MTNHEAATTELSPCSSTTQALPDLQHVHDTYIHAATSDNTRKAYQADIRHFYGWGGLLPTTVEVMTHYLHDYAEQLNPRTLERRLVALKQWHTSQGFPDPTCHPLVRKTLKGIKRLHGAPPKQATALSLETLQTLTDYLQKKNSLIDLRNNALLQIGFLGAFRRSELVAIRWEQITWIPNEGIEILIPRSKTDKEGDGAICAIPYGDQSLCAVSALEQWCTQSGCHTDYVFRQITKGGTIKEQAISAARVNVILKRLAYQCQLSEPLTYSGHSLRRGFATTASQNQAPLSAIMQHGRWRHEKTVLNYIEAGQRFDTNAARMIFENKSKSQEE